MPKPARLALLALIALLAAPAATVHAAQRMPIGFFDDPSFRWSADPCRELQAGERDRCVSHPHDRELARSRADQAGRTPRTVTTPPTSSGTSTSSSTSPVSTASA